VLKLLAAVGMLSAGGALIGRAWWEKTAVDRAISKSVRVLKSGSRQAGNPIWSLKLAAGKCMVAASYNK